MMTEKLICKKDWTFDGKVGYFAGKEYKILKKDSNDCYNSVLIKADGEYYFEGWFHSGSDYFDVDLLF